MEERAVAVTCALASASSPTETLVSAITAAGIQLIELRTSVDILRDVKASDFVLATLDTKLAPAVLLEVGMALGARKPILLLTAAPNDIPIALADQPAIFLDKLSVGDLRQQLLAFCLPLTTKSGSSTSVGPPVSGRTHGGTAKGKGGTAKTANPRRHFASTFEAEVASLLEAAGANVVAQDLGPQNLDIPDLAATFPEFAPSLSPIFVELAGLHADLGRKTKRLAEVLDKRGVLLGLLVTLDETDENLEVGGRVLVVSLARLRVLVRSDTLGAELWRARNRIVHEAL